MMSSGTKKVENHCLIEDRKSPICMIILPFYDLHYEYCIESCIGRLNGDTALMYLK